MAFPALQILARASEDSQALLRSPGSFPESHRALKASRLPCQEPDRAFQSPPSHPECPKTPPQLLRGPPPGARQSPPDLLQNPRVSQELPTSSQKVLQVGSQGWGTWVETRSKQNTKKKSSDFAKVLVLLRASFNFTSQNLWKPMKTQLKSVDRL